MELYEATPLENRQIRVFLALFEERTLRGAASRLNLAESSVSRTLKDLERSLKVSLFDRTPRGMSPTIFGTSFAKHARSIRAELNRAIDELIDLGGGSGGTASIGITPSFAAVLLPRACARVHSKHANANIKVYDGLHDELIPRLITGELDLVVSTLTPYHIVDPTLTIRTFERGGTAAVVLRGKHPLATAREMHPQDLQDQMWVLPRRPDFFRETLNRRFLELDLRPPQPRIEVGSFLTLKSVLVEDDYLSFLPLSFVHREILDRSVTVINIKALTVQRTAGIIKRKDSSLSAVAKTLEREILSLANGIAIESK